MATPEGDVLQTAARACAARLQEAPAVIGFPTDRPRPAALGRDVAGLEISLEASLVQRLELLATASATNLATVLLAGWLCLIHRTTDESDIVLGYAGQEQPDGAAGLLVLRHEVDSRSPFRDVVAAAGKHLDSVAAEGQVALGDVLTALSAEPGPTKHPVYQVGLAQLSQPGGPPWPAAGVWNCPPDLVLAWWHDGETVGCRLDFSPELFERRRITRLAAHLVNLLEAGSGEPATPVGALALLSQDEIDELAGWNATGSDHDEQTSLGTRFRQQALRTPDAVAVEHLGAVLTYRELTDQADRWASVLQAEGVRPGVVVAICAERSFDMVVGVLAVLLAGGAYVPVDPAYPDARRSFMIEDSGAAVVLTQRSMRDSLSVPQACSVLLLDDGDASTPVSTGSASLATAASGEDLGYVIYTSGSTGQPKGVALSQSALGNMVAWQLERPQGRTESRTLQFSSLSFDVSFQEIFSTWCSGGTLVLVPESTRRDPLTLLRFVVDHRITRLFLPYVALRGLASAVASTGEVPETVSEIYTAGEQLQADPSLRALLKALPHCRLENQYGPSESHVVTAHTLDSDVDTWASLPPIGRPIANSEVHVLDAGRRLRPVGVPGELYLGGACLARGYLGRPDLTAERFVELELPTGRHTRLYRTGDVARWLFDGTLEYLGRTDNQVKFRGYRIEPGEIGLILSGAPGVEQCVCVVRDVDGTGARLIAYLLPSGQDGVDLGAIHAHARAELPSYMVPSHYLILSSLPLTSSGKVDTSALPEVAFDRGILSSAYVEPSSTDEIVLTAIWQRLLGISDIGVRDDFFELGGDSLAAVEMVEMISERLDVELPLGALAQGPTIAQLATALRRDAAAVWRSLVPLQTGGARTPLFIVHGGTGNVATFPRLARALPSDQPVYAVQWDGLDGSPGRRTIEAMARHYLTEVRSVQPRGPYLFAGQCIGGLVAREMTRLVQQDDEEVALLVMYDSPHIGSPHYTPGPVPSRLDTFMVPNGRRAKVEILVRNTLRLSVPLRFRARHGQLAMVQAGWAHRPSALPRPALTHYLGSGESLGKNLGMSGSWSDAAMGWSSEAADSFLIHRVEGGHNEILYHPDALALLTRLLDDVRDASDVPG